MGDMGRNLGKKLRESVMSIIPISALVIIIAFSIGGVDKGVIGMFAVGAVLLVLGMGLFTLGADIAMMPMGGAVGSTLSKSRKLWLIILACFVMGMLITIAEPDLQVLATQLSATSEPNMSLIIAVAAGVGAFLVMSVLKTFFRIRLRYLLVGFYGLIFLLAIFVPREFLAVSFDSGGVTTGPITVPFLMSLGVGIAAVRGGSSNSDDSFGMIALCSIGPVIAVMIMGISGASDVTIVNDGVPAVDSFGAIMRQFGIGFPHYLKEVAIALAPILVVFFIFQFTAIHLPKGQIIRILVGIVYTYVGLSIFLTGVNIGFMPLGRLLGETIGARSYNWILIPIAMVIGALVIFAEPAVHVLNKQVEEVTGGSITARTMLVFLAVGVSLALGLSMVRVLTGISIWYILLPGYGIALLLAFFVPDVMTGIAFDSGGVASGPMTATFILPFAMGACEATGGSVLTDAFGLVAFVALAPLITIQILGLIYKLKTRKAAVAEPVADEEIVDFDKPQTLKRLQKARPKRIDRQLARLMALQKRLQDKINTLQTKRGTTDETLDNSVGKVDTIDDGEENR